MALHMPMASRAAQFLSPMVGVADGATKSLTLGLVGSLIMEFLSFIGLAASISALSIAYGAMRQTTWSANKKPV